MDNNVDVDDRRKGFEWCKESLGGTWATLQDGNFEFKTFSGGLTNKLYLCTIPSHVNICDNEPRTVLLRIYGDIVKKDKAFVLKNTVIFAILSEKNLGPKPYCMHPEGRLEEYIPTRPLSRAEIQSAGISARIAEKLASFHSLEMPLCKEPNMLKDTMSSWLIKVEPILHNDTEIGELRQTLLSFDLGKEKDELFEILSKVDYPVKFCHNDFQEGNLLYLPNERRDRQLIAIDWEYCSYNYRGFDFGNHFCEWCLDYQNAPEYPNYTYHPEDYPSREKQYTFFKHYLSASGATNITEEDLQKLYTEANTFALASHFFWGLWSIVQTEMSGINFGFWKYAVCRFEAYRNLKKDLPDMLKAD